MFWKVEFNGRVYRIRGDKLDRRVEVLRRHPRSWLSYWCFIPQNGKTHDAVIMEAYKKGVLA